MDVYIQGNGTGTQDRIALSQADFVAQGGEGSIYVKGDRAFKIYTDPKKLIPPAKIQELAALTLPTIVRPQALLLDAKNNPVGYTMRRISGGISLCQLFTRSFRERKGIRPEQIMTLVERLQAGVMHVHEKGILIVDLNEMNFLADLSQQSIWFIDVDSYQTPGFPPTALMESVRDHHASSFSEDTDWFSFGVVSFQMFVGIHPYKGKYAAGGDLDSRMSGNISVFNKAVSIPKVCYPFDVIPLAYRDWYRAVFEEGKRCPPPREGHSTIVVPVTRPVERGERLHIKELYRFPGEIVFPIFSGPSYSAVTTDELYVGTRKCVEGVDLKVGVTPRGGHVIAAWIQRSDASTGTADSSRSIGAGSLLRLVDVTTGNEIQGSSNVTLAAEALTGYEGRLYVKNGSVLYEIEWLELPSGLLPALKPVGNVLAHATELFDGVAIQSLLGSYYASIFPRAGRCYSVRLPELDGSLVVDARCSNNVLMVLAAGSGRYRKLIYRFGTDYSNYDLRVVEDVAPAGLNFVVLGSGICVHLNENEEIELFSNQKDSKSQKIIVEPAAAGAKLFTDGAHVYFSNGDRLYSITMQGD